MVFVQDIFGYTATEFMFHRPSEHNIEGSCYDLEMQIAHKLKIELSSVIFSLSSVPPLRK